MLAGKKLIVVVLSLIIITILTGITKAKSVYVVRDTGTYEGDDSYIHAYNIQDSNLIDQEIDYKTVTKHAIDIAIDTDSDLLFVTFEDSDEIELVNAKTMQYADTVTAPGATDLAGIAMDTDSKVLFDLSRFSGIIVYNSHEKCRKASRELRFKAGAVRKIQTQFEEVKSCLQKCIVSVVELSY